MKRRLTLILILGGWFISNIHRAWNNITWSVDLFLFSDFKQDFQWYVYDSGNMLNMLCMCVVAWLWVPGKLKLIAIGAIVVQLLDLTSYWLWHKQSESLLFVQGVIFLILSIITFKRWTDQSSYGR